MELIIGGAYQGKTEYAKTQFLLSDEDIFICDYDGKIDFSKKCISHIEKFCFYCAENGLEPKDIFSEHQDESADKIIISDDISCGVVPIDKTERLFREATGRLLLMLSEKSKQVTRIFCGLPQRLK